MSNHSLAIDIALAADATRQVQAQLAAPLPAGLAAAAADGDGVDELRLIKAELRHQTHLLQTIAMRLEELTESLLSED